MVATAADTSRGWLWFSAFRGLLAQFSFGSLQSEERSFAVTNPVWPSPVPWVDGGSTFFAEKQVYE